MEKGGGRQTSRRLPTRCADRAERGVRINVSHTIPPCRLDASDLERLREAFVKFGEDARDAEEAWLQQLEKQTGVAPGPQFPSLAPEYRITTRTGETLRSEGDWLTLEKEVNRRDVVGIEFSARSWFHDAGYGSDSTVSLRLDLGAGPALNKFEGSGDPDRVRPVWHEVDRIVRTRRNLAGEFAGSWGRSLLVSLAVGTSGGALIGWGVARGWLAAAFGAWLGLIVAWLAGIADPLAPYVVIEGWGTSPRRRRLVIALAGVMYLVGVGLAAAALYQWLTR
jgi:hypothetical protein